MQCTSLLLQMEFCSNVDGRRAMVSLLFEPFPRFENRRYVGIFLLPRQLWHEYHTAIFIIGKRRCYITQIEEKSRCKIGVVQKKTKQVHVCVFGKNTQDVAQGLYLLRSRFETVGEILTNDS